MNLLPYCQGHIVVRESNSVEPVRMRWIRKKTVKNKIEKCEKNVVCGNLCNIDRTITFRWQCRTYQNMFLTSKSRIGRASVE